MIIWQDLWQDLDAKMKSCYLLAKKKKKKADDMTNIGKLDATVLING